VAAKMVATAGGYTMAGWTISGLIGNLIVPAASVFFPQKVSGVEQQFVREIFRCR
jgi:hypothetical protein